MKKFHATILVVDDNQNDQILIERAFRKNGVTDPIQIVGDGTEAIAYMMGEGKYSDRVKYEYPTFIIMDLKLPKADGFAVLAFLKDNPLWKIIPTVIFSASRNPDDIRKSYMLGASSYHVKPNSAEEITKQLALIHAYWLTCEVPEVSSTGKQLETNGSGKLAEVTLRRPQ